MFIQAFAGAQRDHRLAKDLLVPAENSLRTPAGRSGTRVLQFVAHQGSQ